MNNLFHEKYPAFMSAVSYIRASLNLFSGKEPADQLINQTVRQEWRLILLNFSTSLLQALTEGATLGVVFLAVESLTKPEGTNVNWSTKPLFSLFPAAITWLNGISPSNLFFCLLCLAVLLQATQSLSSYFNSLSVGYFAARCQSLVRKQIHSQILNLSFACASSYKIGDLTSYSGTGPEAIRRQIECNSGLFLNFLLGSMYLLVLVRISPWLLLAVACMLTLITFVQRKLIPRIKSGSKAVVNATVSISTRTVEDIQGLRLLHCTGQLEAANQRFQSGMDNLEFHMRAQVRLASIVGPFSSFLPILSIAIIGWLSVLLLGSRTSGVLPSLIIFVLALQRLNQRVAAIAQLKNALASNTANVIRLNEILRPSGKQFRRCGGIPFESLKTAIRFDDVCLCYSSEARPALEGISFELQKGQMLALVGPSGAGKSSIADLLVGLYSPTSGQIFVDEHPFDQIDLATWQQHLGVVSQDTFLINATIAENIAFGTPRARLNHIRSAAKQAQADEFIRLLPDGYDTPVGERGYRISGGQRQRISLARAILRQPELLILDEATSALDSQSERLVQEAIEELEGKQTTIVIAHRLSTIVDADIILVLENGRIVEQGDHNSLLKSTGLYRRLWNQQILNTQAIP